MLGNPGIGRMAGHCHMHHLACLQFDDEEGKEGAKEEVGDRQAVARARPACAWLCKKVPQVCEEGRARSGRIYF